MMIIQLKILHFSIDEIRFFTLIEKNWDNILAIIKTLARLFSFQKFSAGIDITQFRTKQEYTR